MFTLHAFVTVGLKKRQKHVIITETLQNLPHRAVHMHCVSKVHTLTHQIAHVAALYTATDVGNQYDTIYGKGDLSYFSEMISTHVRTFNQVNAINSLSSEESLSSVRECDVRAHVYICVCVCVMCVCVRPFFSANVSACVVF